MSKEYDSYRSFLKEIQDPTLKTRAELSLKYYIDQAVLYKRLWQILSVSGIVLPALATVFASINGDRFNTAVIIITACTTVITGVLAFLKCADKKNSYRNSAENLKSELCAYASGQGIYAENPREKDAILFKRMESIIKEGYQKIEALEKDKEKETGAV